MKKIVNIFFAVFLLTISTSYSQNTKAFKKLFVEAESYFIYRDYINALPKYMELIKMEPLNSNINYAIGLCCINLPGKIDDAIVYLERAATDVTPTHREGSYKEKQAPEEAIFWLATAYRLNDRLEIAIETYEKYRALLDVSEIYFIEFVDLQIRNCRNAKELKANPVEIVKEKLNTNVNSDGDEISPVINRYENIFVFARKVKMRDREINEDYYVTHVFQSFKVDNEWSKPLNITKKIGSEGYCYPTYISDDGTFLIVERDDYGVYNLYETEKQGTRWLEVEKMSKNINSRANDKSGRLTKDGETIYFISDRAGGYGEKDIYKSVRNAEGEWQEPTNLGPKINTQFNEESPIFDQDNNILYFSSEGHHGMGGYDIFTVKLQDNGEWSEPLNIGYPANTLGDDLGYFPLNNEYAYYSTFSDKVNSNHDIYKLKIEPVFDEELQADNDDVDDSVIDVEMPTKTDSLTSDVKDDENEESDVEISTSKTGTVVYGIPEITLNGKINLQDNKEEFDNFNIEIINSSSNKTVASISPDNSGFFTYVVNPGNYKLLFSGDNYKENSTTVNLPADYNRKIAEVNIEMIPIEVSAGEYFVIKSVFFDYNDFSLARNSQIELEKLSALMTKNPSLYLEVIGHTDSRGSSEYNLALSKRRSRSVIEYLVNKGINNERFVAKAVGEEQEIAINQNPDGTDNPEGRKYNRRVDIKIVQSNSDNIVNEDIYVPEHLSLRSSLTYTILLIETEKNLGPSYFNKYKDQGISNVWIFPSSEGYAYSLGEYHKKSDALQLLNKAVDIGFPDAKIINSLELKKLQDGGTPEAKAAVKKQKETLKSGTFTIQLMALKNPVDIGYFKNLENVDKYLGKDGYTRYTYGRFQGYDIAKEAIQAIINKGYTDAFVVNMERYK